jgi:hypothetical protein
VARLRFWNGYNFAGGLLDESEHQRSKRVDGSENKGIEIDVYDSQDKHLGDLIVTKSGLTWCKGRTRKENGTPVSWSEFIAWMESE